MHIIALIWQDSPDLEILLTTGRSGWPVLTNGKHPWSNFVYG